MAKVWSIRGVPEALQHAASAAARRDGTTLGRWMECALQAALETHDNAQVDASILAHRLTALERAVDVLRLRVEVMEDDTTTDTAPTTAATPPATADRYTTGGAGTRRRLTPEGVEVVASMIRAGHGDAEVAAVVGMDRGAIRQRRRKMEAGG